MGIWVISKPLLLQTAYSRQPLPGLLLHCAGVLSINSTVGAGWCPGAGIYSSRLDHVGRSAHCSTAQPTDKHTCHLIVGLLPVVGVKWSFRIVLIYISLTRRLSIFSYEWAIFILFFSVKCLLKSFTLLPITTDVACISTLFFFMAEYYSTAQVDIFSCVHASVGVVGVWVVSTFWFWWMVLLCLSCTQC